MATPNIVPRADQEGGLGTAAKSWGKLFIENATGGGTAAVTISNLDIDKVALDINANNTTAHVLDITSDALTTGNAINISADGLSTGSAIKVEDAGSDVNIRGIIDIAQTHASAKYAYPIKIDCNGAQNAINIDHDFANTATSTVAGYSYLLDKTGASTSNNTLYGFLATIVADEATAGTNNAYGIACTVTNTHASDAGTPTTYGADFSAVGSSNGASTAYGIKARAGSADTNIGGWLQAEDGGTDLLITSSADTGDYFSISTTTHGATTLATVDDDSNDDADLTLDVDGKIVVEAKAGDEAVFNEGGLDVDFRVEAVDETHMIFVEGSSNRVSIGDSADSPAATVEITNHASAGATGVPVLQLNSNDVDQIALDINAANTTKSVVDIQCDALTTDHVIDISADALLSGSAIFIDQDDAYVGAATRSFIKLDYDKSGVTGDGVTSAITGLDVNLADAATNHANSVTTKIGAQIDIDSANAAGTLTQKGLVLNVAADGTGDAATTSGIEMEVMDGGTDIKCMSHADNTDYFSIATTTNGATTLKTVDAGAAAAHLTFDIDGEVLMNAATKLSFHDVGGGENILASSDGHLEVNAGSTVDITAPTIDMNASTAVTFGGSTVSGPAIQVLSFSNSSAVDRALSAAESGALVSIDPSVNNTNTIKITLPTMAAGLNYRFIITADATNAAADVLFTSASASHDFRGHILSSEGGVEIVANACAFTLDMSVATTVATTCWEVVGDGTYWVLRGFYTGNDASIGTSGDGLLLTNSTL